MSSDMMIVCDEDKSSVSGVDNLKETNTGEAFFIDECSMGTPSTQFGNWFGERYCGAPSMIEQLAGIKKNSFKEFTEADMLSVKKALEVMETHKGLDKDKLLSYLKEHIGKHISTENW